MLGQIVKYGFYLYIAVAAVQVWFICCPTTCVPDTPNCLGPAFPIKGEFDIHIWATNKKQKNIPQFLHQNDPFWSVSGLNLTSNFEEKIQVPVKQFGTRKKGGKVQFIVSLVKTGLSPKPLDHANNLFWKHGTIGIVSATSKRFYTQRTRKKLLENSEKEDETPDYPLDKKITHWKEFVKFRIITTNDGFPVSQFGALFPELKKLRIGRDSYGPIFYADEFHLRSYHQRPLDRNVSREDPYIRFEFQPTGIAMFRVMKIFEMQVEQLKKVGIAEDDLEGLLYMVSPERIWRFALTTIISIVHSFLSFMAFKNDVGFFMERETLEGLSRVGLIGNLVCDIIILLYLFDSDGTSSLILGTYFVQTSIQVWKVMKVLKVQITSGGLKYTQKTDAEKESNQHDMAGFKYLAYVLVPLVIGSAIYALFNYEYKSFYSWFITSAARSVYAFGFLMMVPQVWINYKLKSVAHLPLRALAYKAFSTFVDDAFAWLIEMPTMHRLATLRDDLIFFIFLYQMWIYPVDYSRANEYGRAYEKPKDAIEAADKVEESDLKAEETQPLLSKNADTQDNEENAIGKALLLSAALYSLEHASTGECD